MTAKKYFQFRSDEGAVTIALCPAYGVLIDGDFWGHPPMFIRKAESLGREEIHRVGRILQNGALFFLPPDGRRQIVQTRNTGGALLSDENAQLGTKLFHGLCGYAQAMNNTNQQAAWRCTDATFDDYALHALNLLSTITQLLEESWDKIACPDLED